MKKIFLFLFLLALIFFPNKAFSLTYDKKSSKGWVNYKESKMDTEGFFGIASSCLTLGEERSYGLIQGTMIGYLDGGVRDFQKGIFDCRTSKDSKIRFSITEGLVEFTKPYEIQVYFKTQDNIHYVYRKIDGKWYLITKSAAYADWSDSRANFKQRLANNSEEKEAEKLLHDAKLLEEAGCFALVLEKIPAKLAEKVAKTLKIPVIGIGAGGGVDGQVLVLHDMLGMTKEFNPRFLRRYLNLHDEITNAVGKYIDDVKSQDFPNASEQY